MSEYCYEDINGKRFTVRDSIDYGFVRLSDLTPNKKEEETMVASGTKVVYLISTNDFDVEPNSDSKGFTAKKSFTYKDDADACVVGIQDAEGVLMWDPILFPNQLTQVFVTGYDVHYERDNNEVTLKLVHAR